MKPLSPYEKDCESVDLSFAGEIIQDEKQALDFSIGNLDISSRKLEKVTNFDPANAPFVENPSFGKRAPHPSIWFSQDILGKEKTEKKVDEGANHKITSCFSITPKQKDVPCRSKKELSEHKQKIAGKKSIEDEQVWYVSKYFKPKMLKENESTLVPSSDIIKDFEDISEEDSSENIMNLYKEPPKSVIKTPPRTQSDIVKSRKSLLEMNDEEQENIFDETKVQSTKRVKKFQFSPTDNSDIMKCEGIEKKDNNWFDHLEVDTALEDVKVIYNTQAIESHSMIPKDNNDENNFKLGTTSFNNFRCSPATRQAFKPVLLNKNTQEYKNDCLVGVQESEDLELEKTKKRNPFAKILADPPKQKPVYEKIEEKDTR